MSRYSLLDFYREIVNSEKSFGVDYKNLSKQLIERIDEAIEFIKENAKYDITINQCRNKLFDFECDDLLNILGGKE